jgi:hypothetical protein
MATGASKGDDAQLLLSRARELAQQVRKEQRATWLPLLVFAVLTFAFIAVHRYSGHHLDCRTASIVTGCRVYSDAEFVYWPIATVLAYAGIAVFYFRRSAARGLGTRVRPYAITGITAAVALTVVAFWELHSSPLSQHSGLNPDGLRSALATPGGAIGLALLVLAWAERNRSLLLLTLVFLAVVLLPTLLGSSQFDPPWYALPAVWQGSVLLLGGVGFALAQRPLLSPSP